MTAIVVVGNTVLDVCVDVDVTELPPGRQIPAAVSFQAGGGLPNVGLDLVALGSEVRAVGAIGDDPVGSMLGAMLPWSLVRCAGATTEVSVIAARGDRTIVNQQGSASLTLDGTGLVPEGALVVMAYLNCSAVPPGDTVAFLASARAQFARIVAGMNGVFSEERRTVALEAMPYVNLLVLNEIEARWLTYCERLDDVLSGLELLVPEAIVTRAAQGAVYVGPTSRTEFTVEPVADARSLGAGDALLAGVAAALNAGTEPVDACAEGCRVAARWVRREFDRPTT